MIVDSHNHFWLYNSQDYGWISDELKIIRRDFEPEDLLIEHKKNGVNGCIAVQARQSIAETRWLLELAQKHDFILGVVGWVDLKSASLEDELIELTKNKKFIGVRHVIQDETDPEFVMNTEFLHGISLLSKYHLTYDILVFEHQLPQIIKMVELFPKQKFVVDHIAKPRIKSQEIDPWKQNIEKLASFPNVYCKLSGMLTEANWQSWDPKDFQPYFDVVFSCFGSSRLMFGSDWPVSLLAGSYQQTTTIITDYMSRFPEEEKRAVMGKNAINFYLNTNRKSQWNTEN